MNLFEPQPKPQPQAAPSGPVVPCDRCGILLRFRKVPSNPDARIMRHAQKPKGVCATCGFRNWLATDYGGAIQEIIERDCKNNPAVLQMPHIQEIIKTAMKVGQCEAPFEEIDFGRLVQEWELPIMKAR